MKKHVYIFAFFVVLGLLFSMARWQAQGFAQSNAADRRCKNAQSYARTSLRKNDLIARVDRAQAYQYMYERLEQLAQRLEHNKQAGAPPVRKSLTLFSKKIIVFKDAYESYDAARDSFSELADCQNNMKEFTARLQTMRQERKAVNQAVGDINTLLTEIADVELGDLSMTLSEEAKN